MSSENELESEREYSIWTHLSFNLVMFMLPASYAMFATHLFWFYETEILLPVIFVGIAMIIFGIWDAINDPLVGYLSDKPNRFTKRFGRRFPFIIMFGIPLMVSLVLLFYPPITDGKTNPWPIFLWLVIILLIHELSYTAVSLARALYPEKFRSDADRNINGAIFMVISTLGIFVGFIIPMLIVQEGNLQSYWIAAIILMIPAFLFFLLGIPGVREDKIMIFRALETERDPFFKTLKSALKRKNFMALVLTSISIMVFDACLMGSIYYYVKYILMLPLDSQADVMLMVVWFSAGLLSVPFWAKVIKKVGNKKMLIYGLLITIAPIIPILFVRDLYLALFFVAIMGLGMGARILVRWPIFADVIDELTIIDGKRQEGVYQGVFAFCDRIGIILQPIIFVLVHIVTRFDPESDTQTTLAQQGILAAMLWIPGLIMLVACLAFWKLYDLTPGNTHTFKAKLKELNL